MRQSPGTLAVHAAYALLSLACVATAAYAFAYLFMAYRGGDPFAANFAATGLAVPAHFFGAGLALLLVPLQLSATVRRRWPRLHRLGGGLSALAILVGGLSGLALAQHAQGGWPSRIGFSLLALLWLGITAQGLRYALAGQFARHRRWMAYSIALTAGAVSLRLMLAAGALWQLPFMTVYVTAAWASWLLNLALCWAWLRWIAPLSAGTRGGVATPWGFRRQSA